MSDTQNEDASPTTYDRFALLAMSKLDNGFCTVLLARALSDGQTEVISKTLQHSQVCIQDSMDALPNFVSAGLIADQYKLQTKLERLEERRAAATSKGSLGNLRWTFVNPLYMAQYQILCSQIQGHVVRTAVAQRAWKRLAVMKHFLKGRTRGAGPGDVDADVDAQVLEGAAVGEPFKAYPWVGTDVPDDVTLTLDLPPPYVESPDATSPVDGPCAVSVDVKECLEPVPA